MVDSSWRSPGIDLYWVPLGAGARVVRSSGKVYEALAAAASHRRRQDLYHSALVAHTADGRYCIEMAPVRDALGTARGVVAEGPVGTKRLARFRVFRYEVRRWLEGEIPDLAYAVASPVPITRRASEVAAVLELLPGVPTPVWGRDQLRTGDMWNSNSVTSWVLAQAGLLTAAGRPPMNGRAPGWDAGVQVAKRSKPRSGPLTSSVWSTGCGQ
jgi:hypothetical protein